jgi:hypothetical protein
LEDSRRSLNTNVAQLQLQRRHSAIDPENFLTEIEAGFNKFLDELATLKRGQPGVSDDDQIRATIDELLKGKIGEPLSSDELLQLYKDGKARFEQKRPPGYKDAGKAQHYFEGNRAIPQQYGDLILWIQLCKEVQTQKHKYIIFVTDDDKEDWWWISSGKTLGPRPELVDEIRTVGAEMFYIYSSARFLDYARQYLDTGVRPESITQVQEISQVNEKAKSPTKQQIEQQILKEVHNWASREFSEMKMLGAHESFDFTGKMDDKILGFIVKYLEESRYLSSAIEQSLWRKNSLVRNESVDTIVWIFVFGYQPGLNMELLRRDLKSINLSHGSKMLVIEARTQSEGYITLQPVFEMEGMPF